MRTVGKVKWFDAATGEGCALSDGGSQAAFTRATLEPFGIDAVEAGVALVYDARIEAGRLIVGAIHEIEGKVPGGRPQSATAAAVRVKGSVQWFDPIKGYGFVASEDIRGDLLLRRSIIEAFGMAALRDGALLDCDVVASLKGYVVTRIHAVSAPDTPLEPSFLKNGCIMIGGGKGPAIDLRDLRPVTPKWFRHPADYGFILTEADDVSWEYAVCKWFSRPKGYGFLELVDGGADIFVHMDVLRLCGVRELRAGQRVRVKVEDTERGLCACEVKLDLEDED